MGSNMTLQVLRSCVSARKLESKCAGGCLASAWLPAIVLILAAAFGAGPAQANVDLRVVAQPINQPIQGFVTVTDPSGNPELGLIASDFTVTLDGRTLSTTGFSLPPAQDPAQKLSVIFVMDYSSSVQGVAKDAMETAVKDFIGQMKIGENKY